MKINSILCLFVFWFICSIKLTAQITPYHYSIPTDVSNQLIFCIEQDQHGRLLIGTDNGLYRYNGFRSTRIESNGAFSKEITKIIRVNESILMTNRAGQVLELKNDQLKPLILKDLSGDIRSISVQGGYLEITTQKSNYSYSIPNFDLVEKEAIPFTEAAGAFVNDFLFTRNSRFAVLNSGEIIDVEQNEARYIPKATGKQLIQFANQLVIIPSYTSSENVYSYSNGQFNSFGPLATRRNVNTNKAKQIGNKLFVLSDYGVFVYQNNLNRRPVLWFEGIAVTDIFEDLQGNMWIATKGKGLLYIPAGRHEIVNSTSFLSIQNGPSGSFFGGNSNGIITQFNSNGEQLNQFFNTASNQEIQFLYTDPNSQFIFTNSSIFPISQQGKPVTLNEPLKSVSRLKTGEIMLSKSSGVLLYKNTSTKDFLKHVSDSNAFLVITKEPGRQLATHPTLEQTAIATENGLYIFTNNQPLKPISYYGKPIDAQSLAWFGNDLYVGTRNNKILVIRAGKVLGERSLSKGFGELMIIKMISNNRFLYLLTEKGIYRINSMKGKIETLKDVIGFDGLAMRDFTIKNDELHIATQRGVLRYAWNQINKIETSMVVGNPYGSSTNSSSSMSTFDADEKLIVIPFECVDLSGSHQFIIQYRIHTEEERGIWNSLPANSEQINFSHLNSGEYTIEMRILDPVSRSTSAIETRKFSITESWYEAAWLNWFAFGVISTCFLLFFIRRYELKTRISD